tara:strand:+ start:353 stop:724 length:372 start_codon:yes stop_codon:yes gene_type:complete
MSFIRIEDNHQSFPAGEIRKHKDYYIVYFNKRPLWLLLRNIYYDENMKAEFPNEHYKSVYNVPIYSIMKKSKKVGMFFARTAEATGNDFLFCPKNRDIKKNYYVWDLKDKHIINDKANIMRLL